MIAMEVRSYSELTRKDVFTTKGVFAGNITDVALDLDKFKIKSLIVDAVRGSFLASLVGDKKGIVVPYAMVQSVGDIIIIKHITPHTVEEEEKPTEKAIKY